MIHTWHDSAGTAHRIADGPLLTLGEAALRMGCSIRTARRRMKTNALGPVIRLSARDVRLLKAGVDDFVLRAVSA